MIRRIAAAATAALVLALAAAPPAMADPGTLSWYDDELSPFVQGQPYTDGVSATGSASITYVLLDGDLPAGLALNETTGAVTGTTNSTSSYHFVIRATSPEGELDLDFDGIVHGLTTWTDSTIAPFYYEVAYSDGVSATSNSTVSYVLLEGDLPTGISFDESTGALTGTPSVLGQAYDFYLSAGNGYTPISENYTGYVLPPVAVPVNVGPSWDDSSLAPFQQGLAYSYGVSASGTAPLLYEISEGALPAGLSLNSSTGVVSGTTNSNTTYSFQIHVSNGWGDIYKDYTGIVYGPTVWIKSSINPFVYNTPYSDFISASSNAPVSFSVQDGDLPTGVTLDEETGTFAGTPTVNGESYEFLVVAGNGVQLVTQVFTGTVITAPVWTDSTLSPFVQGAPYTDGVSAAGAGTITYAISHGALPNGLTLNAATGAVTGTTNDDTTYSFEIHASSVHGDIYQQFSGIVHGLTVWTSSAIPPFYYSVPYTATVSATSNSTVYYALIEGNLPRGITFDEATATLSGTPTTLGESYDFYLSAGNGYTPIAQQYIGTVQSVPVNGTITPGFSSGDEAEGAEFSYSVTGAMPGAAFTVIVFSTPQLLASGTASGTGTFGGSAALPSLPAGQHRIEITTTALDGTTRTTTLWFTVLPNGHIGGVSTVGPVAYGALAATGVEPTLFGGLAALLVVVGVVLTRRRRLAPQ